jgi:IclR family acetate operon transcriptional repressor
MTSDGSASYLARLLDLLELTVSDKGALASLSELADRAGMPVSTTSRQLAQLRSWGFLVEVDGGRHAPGPRLISMSAAVARSAYGDQRLKAATRVLTTVTGESATASRIVGDRLVIVARTESGRPLRAVNRTGEVLPASRSAMGKAVLALLPADRQLDFVRADGVPDPEATLAGLQTELAEAAVRGYAVDEETLAVGLRCRAVAVLGFDGLPVAALSVGGPTVRFTSQLADESVPPLQSQAAELAGSTE